MMKLIKNKRSIQNRGKSTHYICAVLSKPTKNLKASVLNVLEVLQVHSFSGMLFHSNSVLECGLTHCSFGSQEMKFPTCISTIKYWNVYWFYYLYLDYRLYRLLLISLNTCKWREIKNSRSLSDPRTSCNKINFDDCFCSTNLSHNAFEAVICFRTDHVFCLTTFWKCTLFQWTKHGVFL